MNSASESIGARVRRTILDMARRRQQPGSGSGAGFLRERTRSVRWPDLTRVLADVPWAIAGAVASRLYMPERSTRALDIVILQADGAAVHERLRAHGFERAGDLSIGGSEWRAQDGTPVDVIEQRESWWSNALADAADNRDDDGAPVLTLPYLVLMKLRSGRTIDIGDVTRMLGLASEGDRDAVRDLVRRHAGDLSEDLESMIELGRLETDS